MLGAIPALAEQHGRALVPLFLAVAAPTGPTPPKTRLTAWLTLFSAFSNPKALYAAADVHAACTALLSHPDRALQRLALTCALPHGPPTLRKHGDALRALLDDTRWREELAGFSLPEPGVERSALVPVVVRLFFGLMRERGARARSGDRRAALLSSLAACEPEELALLVDLMAEPFRDHVSVTLEASQDGLGQTWRLADDTTLIVPEKQQVGFLMFLSDVVSHLGSLVLDFWPTLLAVTVACTGNAQRKLDMLSSTVLAGPAPVDGDADDADADADDEDTGSSSSSPKRLRLIRQLGIRRLAEFSRSPVAFDFAPYMQAVFRCIVSPRLERLDVENTQAPSALLDLFDAWTQRPDAAAFLAQYDARVLTKVYDCLVAPNVKPPVLARIYCMIERLLALSAEDAGLSDLVVRPYMAGLLSNLSTLISRSAAASGGSPTGIFAKREIAVLSSLSSFMTDGTQAATLLTLFLPQLRKTNKVVPENSKADMLKIVSNLLRLIPDPLNQHAALYAKTYETLSHLFQTLRGRQARIVLSSAFAELAHIDMTLSCVADLLSSLNSYSSTRIEEPDFDRRLSAFVLLNESLCNSLTAKDWTPVLHNMLFFIQDEAELSIRNNASLSMKCFIDVLSNGNSSETEACFVRILNPGLKRCLRSKSDLVRSEVMAVFAHAVAKCEKINSLVEMRVLLAGGDEEANFFNNIYHIQIHRRTRALRRLADYCDEPGFRSSTLQEIFIPVVNNFILEAATTDHHLVNEAVLTVGRIAKHLSWTAYFSLVQQYLKLSVEHSVGERTYTRTLVAILDHFHFSLEESFSEPVQGEINELDEVQVNPANGIVGQSMTSKIFDAVNGRLLPSLLKHLEQRDELEDTNRIPIAAGIAKVASYLPEESRALQLNRLLTILAQVFRSTLR